MTACICRNWSPLFKLIKYKLFVFDEVYIFHFNVLKLFCLRQSNDGGLYSQASNRTGMVIGVRL